MTTISTALRSASTRVKRRVFDVVMVACWVVLAPSTVHRVFPPSGTLRELGGDGVGSYRTSSVYFPAASFLASPQEKSLGMVISLAERMRSPARHGRAARAAATTIRMTSPL